MRGDILTRLSFLAMNLVPGYVVLAIGLKALDVSGWIVLLPLFAAALPATIHIATRRCPRCRNLIYSADAAKRGSVEARANRRKPYAHCPTCGLSLDETGATR